MARLPDLPESDVQGAPPSLATLQPTDFGLGQVSQALESVALAGKRTQALQVRVQAKQDREAAIPYLQALQSRNEDAFAQEAAAYKGDQPGFAQDQVMKAWARGAEALNDPTLTPGAKAELGQMVNGETARIGQQAIAHEAKVRAQPILDAQRAQEEVQVNQGMTAFLTQYAPAQQKLLDGYDGSQPGLTQSVAQTFDTAAAQALAATPERLRPQLQGQLAALRTKEVSGAAIAEQKGADAFVLTKGADQANQLINTVVSNPLAYDNVVGVGLPAIAATLPAHLKKDALTQFTGMAAQARIRGLIDQQNFTQAESELKDGRYDAVMKPEVKEELFARVEAEARASGPEAITRAMQGQSLEQQMGADIVATTTTGRGNGLSMDQLAAAVSSKLISPEQVARYAQQKKTAQQVFAAVGPMRDMKSADISALRAQPPPDPSDPAYADKITVWQAQQQAAAEEEKRRQQDPAGWAFDTQGRPASKGAAAAGIADPQNRGAVLQQTYASWLNAPDERTRLQAGAHLAGQSLGVQAAAGIPQSAWHLIPQDQAAGLAAHVINAPPEKRLQALQTLGFLVHGLPTSFKMPDGSTVAPQQILTAQLAKAHMSPLEISAVVDYGANPAALGRVTAAINDPTLKAEPKGLAQLRASAQAALQPFLASAMPLPGSQALEQARIDRTVLVARELMATHGLSQTQAIRTAAADLVQPDAYRYVDTWRMPLSAGVPQTLVKTGAALQLGKLLMNGLLYTPPSELPGTYGDKVRHFARWAPQLDDTGLQLMLPRADGGFATVADKWGRPVALSWSQLAQGADGTRPSPFEAPPPNTPHTAEGQPVPAASRASAFSALSGAVTWQESHGVSGLVSPKGGLGRMQVTEDTVKTYAPRLGLPVDLERARTDDGYNRRIGEAALQDNLGHYGLGNGVILALAAYNAGQGRVDGWLKQLGDPRTGQISGQAFVDRIPFKETREYVRAVLPGAFARLQRGG